MELTKGQFEEIGPWHFNDLCFNSEDQGLMLTVFNLLPKHLQGLAITWGCSDSVFRDDVFEYLLENQFGMTYEEYVESGIGKNFFKNQVYQEIDFEKLDPPKSALDELIDDIGGGYVNGELGIIMAPPSRNKTTWNPEKGRYKEKMKRVLDRNKPNTDV